MIPDYTFRAEHPRSRTTWLLHLLFYFGAFMLLVAAAYSLHAYFTHWSDGDDRSHLWDLLLGIIYLVVSGLIVYATYHHGDGTEEPADRYVDITDGVMMYELDQVTGRQIVDLGSVASTQRLSVRDILLRMKDGTNVVLPVYLVDDQKKQEELATILTNVGGDAGAK